MNLVGEITSVAGSLGVVSRHLRSKLALDVEGDTVTYRELEKRANQMANALIRDGVAPGDRVAVLGKDSLDSLILLFGAAKAKAIWVGVNWRLRIREVAYILSDARPRKFFVDAEFLPRLPEILERLEERPEIVTILADGQSEWPGMIAWHAGESEQPPALEYAPDDVVAQTYTSGTTGNPKGVQLPNRSFYAVAQALRAADDPWIDWTHEDVSLLFVPTFHIGGLWWLIRGLAVGSTNVVLRSFHPGRILETIPRHRVTKTCMVPAMMQVLLNEPGCDRCDFSSLDTIVYGGSPISEALLEEGLEAFGCRFSQVYGMTETGNCAVSLRPEEHRAGDPGLLRSAGRPFPGVRIRVVDRAGTELGPREIGEIHISSPARMAGYWNLPEATAETLLADGFIRTGDAGYVDEAGYVYICDRIKDMIISAGENVYPAEIESVIRALPGVADVAVIGVPDDLWGESVKAVVVERNGSALSARDVIQQVRANLAEFKVPKTVDLVDELPRNASGKVLKTRLRAPFWEGRERRVN